MGTSGTESCEGCFQKIETRRLVYNGGYIQNNNKQLNGSKVCDESRSTSKGSSKFENPAIIHQFAT